GDAAHTAHFSIGSGTKLAMEDSIALVNALETKEDIASALTEYELERKPRVERFQEAARQSQEYFENTAIYRDMDAMQFAFNLLSRSGRIDYDDLRVRDEHFVAAVDRWFIGRDVGPAAPPSFAPLRLRELDIPNRVGVMAAPTYSADDGTPPAGILRDASAAGTGLVFTGTVAVSAHGRITPGCLGLYDDNHVDAWRAEIGGNVAVTLNHSGPRGSTRPRDRAVDVALDDDEGWTTIAATAMRYSSRSTHAMAIDERRKREVIEDFVAATARAAAAGFSLLEIHMGHGYLLGSFLSPLTNPRPLEERLAYPLAVLDHVDDEWPSERPLGVAMNASDWARGGTSLEDAVATARALKEHGCDVIRVLAGQATGRFTPSYDPYFLTHYAERIRNEVKIPTIATGPITTVDRANTLIAGGRADLCLLRALA
ncbi:MAG: bifunctional salicylyl-CoA 5-hydroxylase/oxidoreductase, partial [Actinobacteria bacterium]|nr:bifunctional salicylyl-CoA 5-hydroxylase/oxidoreductase [Actinomycetota bacterium]